MAIQDEDFQKRLNEALGMFGQAPADMPVQTVDPVRAERLAFEASQGAPVASIAPPASVAPVAAPSAEQIMLAQQDAIRQNSLAQRTQAAETAKTIAQRPRQRFLNEGQGFMDAFKNPGAGQRQFAINAGLSLLSSGGTQDLSQRIGHALGAGVQGMQAARQGELDVASKAAQAKQAALAGEGVGLVQEGAFSRDINSLRESQAQQARNEATDALEREKFEFKKLQPTSAPDVMTKRQERRRVLQASLTTLTDPAAIEQANQEIVELNAALAPKTILNPSTGIWERPSTMGGSKTTQYTKQTIDLLGSIAGASQIANEGMGLVYDRTQEKVFGRKQNIPFIGKANQTARALLDQEVSTFLEAKERYSINAMLPFARTLAPVTEIDTKMLQTTKGMLEKSDINAQIREFETKALPDLARMIFDSNMAYKAGDAGGVEGQVYGPQVAAQNQLIFAETSLNGALQGQSYEGQTVPEMDKRTNRLLDMYPSTGVSRNLSGTDGVYSYNGKVVSQNFINRVSKQYGLSPADFMRFESISAY